MVLSTRAEMDCTIPTHLWSWVTKISFTLLSSFPPSLLSLRNKARSFWKIKDRMEEPEAPPTTASWGGYAAPEEQYDEDQEPEKHLVEKEKKKEESDKEKEIRENTHTHKKKNNKKEN